jgi:hypothetical protein
MLSLFAQRMTIYLIKNNNFDIQNDFCIFDLETECSFMLLSFSLQ